MHIRPMSQAFSVQQLQASRKAGEATGKQATEGSTSNSTGSAPVLLAYNGSAQRLSPGILALLVKMQERKKKQPRPRRDPDSSDDDEAEHSQGENENDEAPDDQESPSGSRQSKQGGMSEAQQRAALFLQQNE